MIKIVIANDNDILYNSLSNISLQNGLDIEITEVANSELEKLIGKIKPEDNLIILDSITSITFMQNVLNNATEYLGTKETNIIILVVDSNSISNTKCHYFFKSSNTSILDIIKLVSNSLKDCMELDKKINDILWHLGFSTYFKGSIYLKDAIKIAYNDHKLLLDTQSLVIEVAKKHNVENEKVVRSNMDRTLNSMLNYTNKDKIYEVFGKDYDGREISLKYFIDLCIRYLEKERYCCLEH